MRFEKRAPTNNIQVIAFGYDYNNFEMIIECGIGVAMGNAIDKVKAVADYLCDINEL